MDDPTSSQRTASLARIATIRAEIGSRLRPVMEHLSVEDFDALMERMAHVQHNFEQRGGAHYPDIDTRTGSPERRSPPDEPV